MTQDGFGVLCAAECDECVLEEAECVGFNAELLFDVECVGIDDVNVGGEVVVVAARGDVEAVVVEF